MLGTESPTTDEVVDREALRSIFRRLVLLGTLKADRSAIVVASPASSCTETPLGPERTLRYEDSNDL